MFYRKRGKAMRWFFGWFKISLPGLLAGGLALVSTSALALDIKAWEESINPETKERYIPVELWSGTEKGSCECQKSTAPIAIAPPPTRSRGLRNGSTR